MMEGLELVSPKELKAGVAIAALVAQVLMGSAPIRFEGFSTSTIACEHEAR